MLARNCAHAEDKSTRSTEEKPLQILRQHSSIRSLESPSTRRRMCIGERLRGKAKKSRDVPERWNGFDLREFTSPCSRGRVWKVSRDREVTIRARARGRVAHWKKRGEEKEKKVVRATVSLFSRQRSCGTLLGIAHARMKDRLPLLLGRAASKSELSRLPRNWLFHCEIRAVIPYSRLSSAFFAARVREIPWATVYLSCSPFLSR